MNQHFTQHSSHRSPLTLASRRAVFKASLGSALATLLTSRSRGNEEASLVPASNDKSVILLWLEGGPFQTESFDPKVSTKENLAYRYKPTSTSVAGVQYSECLPELAKLAHHIAVIRSMVGEEGEHNLAQYHMQTGWRNTGPLQAPALGSIVAHELGTVPMLRANPDGLPTYVSINRQGYPAGHFGASFKPTIVSNPENPPENLNLPGGISNEIFDRRLQLLDAVEQGRAPTALSQFLASGRSGATGFMRSSQREAFDLKKESDADRDRYGRSRFGQGCLLARRLVSAGVRFVQVGSEGFDQHADHYPRQIDLFKQLDQGMSNLIIDLEQRGLLENTLVIAAGEFGRTPNFNGNKGRDHWFTGYSVAMAGGGFQGGSVYGAMSETGEEVKDNPVSVPDYFATLLHAVGINPEKEYTDDFDRPIKLVDEGKAIHELLS